MRFETAGSGGVIRALYRHPVKGFTPEPLDDVLLKAGEAFPCDRIYAVENGASGFDPLNPTHISKYQFTVLADIPRVALARTKYDETTGTLSIDARGYPPFHASLTNQEGRDAFADWLTKFLGDTRGPLKVLHAQGHRFLDAPKGHLSLINLESARDLARRLGRAVDPLRFRGNVYFDGWPAWSELDIAPGSELKLGEAIVTVVKAISRCTATHVDPESGANDLEIVPALRDTFGHIHFGLYLQVVKGGRVETGSPIVVTQ